MRYRLARGIGGLPSLGENVRHPLFGVGLTEARPCRYQLTSISFIGCGNILLSKRIRKNASGLGAHRSIIRVRWTDRTEQGVYEIRVGIRGLSVRLSSCCLSGSD